MARLFGFIAQGMVDVSFTIGEASFANSNAQGWGIAWYDLHHNPNVQKGKRSALHPEQNKPVQIDVSTDVFVSHARFATSGSVDERNVHPFRFNNYVFAHSGTVNKELLLDKLTPPMNQNFQSEPIDSEVLFRYILQEVKQKGIIDGVKYAINAAEHPHNTNFIFTDGANLYAYCYGLPLYYLVRKPLAPFHTMSQETGISLSSEKLSQVRAIIISSEKLTDENWVVFDDNELITAHRNLQFESARIL
jgi:predicted glutamine amidotransferase